MTYPTEPVFGREVFRELARPLQHPEALCWDPLTERIYCGGEGGQIYAVTLEGSITEVANTGGSVLGMAVDAYVRVYACDWHREEVVRVEKHGFLQSELDRARRCSPTTARCT